MTRLRFGVLGLGVTIDADGDDLEGLADLYSAFPLRSPTDPIDIALEWTGARCAIERRGAPREYVRLLVTESRAAATTIVLNAAIARTRPDLLLLHANALVDRAGRVLLLAGDSGAGKSTLTAELVTRGWRQLCEDVAPLDPGTGVLHAFPRAILERRAGEFGGRAWQGFGAGAEIKSMTASDATDLPATIALASPTLVLLSLPRSTASNAAPSGAWRTWCTWMSDEGELALRRAGLPVDAHRVARDVAEVRYARALSPGEIEVEEQVLAGVESLALHREPIDAPTVAGLAPARPTEPRGARTTLGESLVAILRTLRRPIPDPLPRGRLVLQLGRLFAHGCILALEPGGTPTQTCDWLMGEVAP